MVVQGDGSDNAHSGSADIDRVLSANEQGTFLNDILIALSLILVKRIILITPGVDTDSV